jgi:hypothetical protein
MTEAARHGGTLRRCRNVPLTHALRSALAPLLGSALRRTALAGR